MVLFKSSSTISALTAAVFFPLWHRAQADVFCRRRAHRRGIGDAIRPLLPLLKEPPVFSYGLGRPMENGVSLVLLSMRNFFFLKVFIFFS